jgi:hypothetical protein
LQFVPDPVAVLSSFGSLLSPGGVCVTILPNASRVGYRGMSIQGERKVRSKGGFEETGIRVCSRKAIKGWFKDAGLPVEKFRGVLGSRAQKYLSFAKGLADSWIASEFVVIAKRAVDRSAGQGYSEPVRETEAIGSERT